MARTSKALLKVSEFEFPVVLNPVTAAYLTQSSRAMPDPEVAAAMKAIAATTVVRIAR